MVTFLERPQLASWATAGMGRGDALNGAKHCKAVNLRVKPALVDPVDPVGSGWIPARRDVGVVVL